MKTKSSSKKLFNQNFEKLSIKDPYLSLLLRDQLGKDVKSIDFGASMPNYDEVDVLYVYGLGVIEKKEKQDLVFVIEDLSTLHAFLFEERASKLLCEEHVYFFLYEKGIESKLSARFPERRVEVIKAPSIKKKKKFEELRLKLLRESVMAEGLFVDRLGSMRIFENFVHNAKLIPESFYLNRWKNAFKKRPAIILGAGPSLDESIEDLKKLRHHALILAGGSGIAAASSKHLAPHLGAAIDPNLDEYYRLKKSFEVELPMIYSTRSSPHIFSTFNGPKGYLRSSLGQVMDLWLEEKLKLDHESIGRDLPEEALSVTTMSLSIAKFLGCDPIILSGVDLGFTDDASYASGVVDDEKHDFNLRQKNKSAEERGYRKKNVLGKTIYTSVKWIMERDAIDQFAKKSKTTFINASRGLKFKNIPYQPLSEIAFGEVFPFDEEIHYKIQKTRIKATEDEVEKHLNNLKKSIEACRAHLEVLGRNASFSQCALHEIELKEEEAYKLLFYDTRNTIEKLYRKEKIGDEVIWEHFHHIVCEFLKAF